jgi:hypothetical protein
MPAVVVFMEADAPAGNGILDVVLEDLWNDIGYMPTARL